MQVESFQNGQIKMNNLGTKRRVIEGLQWHAGVIVGLLCNAV